MRKNGNDFRFLKWPLEDTKRLNVRGQKSWMSISRQKDITGCVCVCKTGSTIIKGPYTLLTELQIKNQPPESHPRWSFSDLQYRSSVLFLHQPDRVRPLCYFWSLFSLEHDNRRKEKKKNHSRINSLFRFYKACVVGGWLVEEGSTLLSNLHLLVCRFTQLTDLSRLLQLLLCSKKEKKKDNYRMREKQLPN